MSKKEKLIADLKEIAAKHPDVPLTIPLPWRFGDKIFDYDAAERLFGTFENFVKAAGLEDRLPESAAAGK